MQESTPVQESITTEQNKTVPESEITKHIKYVIIGGGISAIQAALILAEHQQDFILLEASNRIGGRICTVTIGQAVDENCFNCDFPWLQQDKIRKIPIECGATWVSEDQAFMNFLMKQYGLNLYAQNQEGKHALALDNNQYLYLNSLGQYYNQHRAKILKLFATIKKYTDKIDQLSSIRKEGKLNQQQQNELKHIFETYDTITAFNFIQSEVEDEELGKLLCKQIQTLQSANCHKFTAIQLFTNDEQSSLANVRFYIGIQNANIDGFRVQQGNSELVKRMKNDIQLIYNKQGNGKNIDDQIKLNTPVTQVKNHQSPVIVVTKNGQKYSCEKAIVCLPAATFGRIQFSSLSAGKKLVVQNQLTGNATRMAMIFKKPWWRPDNTGYASFSHKFAMNEFVDLTPEDESVGILAFVFLADGFETWNQQILAECGNTEGVDLKKRWYEVNMKKSMRIVADVYLRGDIENDYLKEVAIFTKSLSQNPYIKSTYDATTGPGVFKDIFQKDLDTTQAQLGDQKNIVILGSDFSDQHCGYMEGAVRIARKKIYPLCGSKDPLESLKGQH